MLRVTPYFEWMGNVAGVAEPEHVAEAFCGFVTANPVFLHVGAACHSSFQRNIDPEAMLGFRAWIAGKLADFGPRLEALLQGLVERPQSLLTPKRVHPLMLSAAVARAFESNVLPVGDRVIGPNDLTIALHPADFDGFEDGVRHTIEGEMAAYVARAAIERGLTLRAPPRVKLIFDSAVRVGTVDVRTAFSEPVAPTVVPRRAATYDIGNPHLVVLVDDPAAVDVGRAGPVLERDYPGGINVHFVAPRARTEQLSLF